MKLSECSIRKKIKIFNLLTFLFFINFKFLFKYKKINIAIYYISIKNGGAQRVTALLINNLSKTLFFNIYLFINKNEKDEYIINSNIQRILIRKGTPNLIKEIKKKKSVYLFINYIIQKK